MGGHQSCTAKLSDFQKKKLLHEFHTFFDLNKNGTLEWKDFEMARQRICQMSGWKAGTEVFMRTQQLFTDIWRRLEDEGDANMDGKITAEEWIAMWQRIYTEGAQLEKKGETPADHMPEWLSRYVKYKFTLYDRTGDGLIDADEYEYVLSDFGVSAKDARTCFLIFSNNAEQQIDLEYFTSLCTQYYRSDQPADLGNFITGRLHFDECSS